MNSKGLEFGLEFTIPRAKAAVFGIFFKVRVGGRMPNNPAERISPASLKKRKGRESAARQLSRPSTRQLNCGQFGHPPTP